MPPSSYLNKHNMENIDLFSSSRHRDNSPSVTSKLVCYRRDLDVAFMSSLFGSLLSLFGSLFSSFFSFLFSSYRSSRCCSSQHSSCGWMVFKETQQMKQRYKQYLFNTFQPAVHTSPRYGYRTGKLTLGESGVPWCPHVSQVWLQDR